MMICFLYEEEDYQLRHDYTHEHRERVDRGVTYGGSVVVGDLVAVSKCRRVGICTGQHTADAEIIHLVLCPCHDCHHHLGDHRDYESVEYPCRAVGSEHCGGEVLTGGESYGGKEQADAQLTEQKVGRRVGVGNQMDLVAVGAQQDGDHKWAARQTEFHRHRHAGELQGNASDDDSQENADEHRYQIGFVQTFHGVPELVGEILDVVDLADYGQTVAHLQTKTRFCDQVHAGAVDARDVQLIGIVQVQ